MIALLLPLVSGSFTVGQLLIGATTIAELFVIGWKKKIWMANTRLGGLKTYKNKQFADSTHLQLLS
ncbi:MAG: hypothetical protein NTY50_18810 [Methylobacter sp.]|nr:hypothetical protein [Methylobacter sp.]